MLAEERFAAILGLLEQKRAATVQELCEALGASESTIRRDLTLLAQQGRVHKVHGGATMPERQVLSEEPDMAAKEGQAVAEKQSIGRAAAALVEEKDFIYLDSGSTTLAMVRALEGPALQAGYVTNGIGHARLLAQKGCRVYLVSGLLRGRTEALVGAQALLAIQQYSFTKAFFGTNGISLNEGFTTPDVEEAAVKGAALGRARESWFLADDSKFGKVYPARIAPLHAAALLTNHCPNPKYHQYTLVKESST